MAIKPLHAYFCAEIVGLDLSRELTAEQAGKIQQAIDQFAVLVFRDQDLDDDAQLRFSALFGELQTSISLHRTDAERRFTRPQLSDISNVGPDGRQLSSTDVRRALQLANLLWHTDNSFRFPSGRYTFLVAKRLPPEGGETEFVDTRAAYDALDAATRGEIANLSALHSLAHSRALAGGPRLSREEAASLPGRVQPIVRRHSGSGRLAVYIGSHAASVVGWTQEQGRALLDRLQECATQAHFIYSHRWQAGDVVMWDNRCTLHRGRPFDEVRYQRELRRTTVGDGDAAPADAAQTDRV